jgi:hypothetical protein
MIWPEYRWVRKVREKVGDAFTRIRADAISDDMFGMFISTSSAAVLNVAPEKVRVITANVGGNFGSKNRPYVEYGLVLWASRLLGRPVKFTASSSIPWLPLFRCAPPIAQMER